MADSHISTIQSRSRSPRNKNFASLVESSVSITYCKNLDYFVLKKGEIKCLEKLQTFLNISKGNQSYSGYLKSKTSSKEGKPKLFFNKIWLT